MKTSGVAVILRSAWAVFLCGVVLTALSGCSTTDEEAPAPGVEVHWNTPGQISTMVREVFEENGFVSAKGDYTKLVYEKKMSFGGNLKYGGWSHEGLWTRVKVAIVPAGEANFRLSCKAFRVEDRGQALEEETALGAHKTEEFNKLLEEVAARLRGETLKK